MMLRVKKEMSRLDNTEKAKNKNKNKKSSEKIKIHLKTVSDFPR